MRKGAVIIGAALLVGAIAAAMLPLWMMSTGAGLRSAGWGAVGLMIVFCFAVGGGLTLMFFSKARRGHDDAAHHGATRGKSAEAENGRRD